MFSRSFFKALSLCCQMRQSQKILVFGIILFISTTYYIISRESSWSIIFIELLLFIVIVSSCIPALVKKLKDYDLCYRLFIATSLTSIMMLSGGFNSIFIMTFFFFPFLGIKNFQKNYQIRNDFFGFYLPLLILTMLFVCHEFNILTYTKTSYTLLNTDNHSIKFMFLAVTLTIIYGLTRNFNEYFIHKYEEAKINFLRMTHYIKNSETYLIVYDANHYNIIWASDIVGNTIGIESFDIRDKLHDKNCENYNSIKEILEQAKKNQLSEKIILEFSDYKNNGELIILEGKAYFTSPFQNTHEIAFLLHDVTLRQLSENSLRHARDCATTLNNAKNAFIAGMSHELRTPLNAVIGFSEMMHSEVWGKLGHDKYREYTASIIESGRHLLDMINDILNQSQIDSGKYHLHLSSVVINDVVSEVIAILNGNAQPKNISLRFDIKGKYTITADKRALKQVLLNIIGNAIRYCPNDSEINIRVFAMLEDTLSIEISDNGSGYPLEVIKHFGTPFLFKKSSHTTNEGGTGLGLSIAKSLTEAHGALIEIFNKVTQDGSITLISNLKIEQNLQYEIPHSKIS